MGSPIDLPWAKPGGDLRWRGAPPKFAVRPSRLGLGILGKPPMEAFNSIVEMLAVSLNALTALMEVKFPLAEDLGTSGFR
jgi:hypothetical protein